MGLRVNARLTVSQQHALANKADSLMGDISSSMANRQREVIIPFRYW